MNSRRLSRKSLLVFGIIINIALLGYFKYTDFFITNANHFFSVHIDLMHIVLPLGISFFTFTQIAYLVDAYRDEVKEMDYLNYTLFVTFFPHLLAGPILHHKEMMPQFDAIRNKAINYKNISAGAYLFSIGLFKKIIIADTFAIWADSGFNIEENLTLMEGWITSLSYTFQLYFDFSGYTDMALGAALMFNIKLPYNFNSPYKALSIQDFWRRWHMTLSRFLRDYIYIPLGGNRHGELHTYANLFAVFLIGGLWHGASWMFVIWGALHGFAAIVHRFWQFTGIRIHRFAAWLITFNFINITWVFFRADEWNDALKVLKGMAGFNGLGEFESVSSFAAQSKFTSVLFLVCFLIAMLSFFRKNSNEMVSAFVTDRRTLLFTLFLLFFGIINLNKLSTFLYFNF